MNGRAEAVNACRLWASVRDKTLMLAETPELQRHLRAFDEQMFRLGEVVYQAEGEVTNVERVGK